MERVTGIEPVSLPWQGNIITIIRYPHVGFRISDIGCQMSDFGYRISEILHFDFSIFNFHVPGAGLVRLFYCVKGRIARSHARKTLKLFKYFNNFLLSPMCRGRDSNPHGV